MKENLTYTCAVKAISKILKIDIPKVVIIKSNEEFRYFTSNNEHLIPPCNFVEIMVEKPYGYTILEDKVVLVLEHNLPEINPLYKELAKIEIIAHELRHVWQIEHNWTFSDALPYAQRTHEVDAKKFACKVLLPILLAINLPTYILQYKIYKSIRNKIFK